MYRTYTFVFVFLLAIGCKYNPASQMVPIKPSPVVRVPQENDVWFKINGTDVDRQKDSLNSRAFAWVELDAAPPNDRLLHFTFTTKQVFQGAVHTIKYSADLLRLYYSPQVYDLKDSDYTSAGFAFDPYTKDVRSFTSRNGRFEITKIDTANNLISGKFSMIGTTDDGIFTDTLTDGYFNDVPISENSYGQGNVTATINKGYFFDPKAAGNLGWVHPYVIRGQNVLHIEIMTTPGDNRTMEIQLPSPPKPGTYSMRAAASDTSVYFHYGEQVSGLYASSGATTQQKFVITRSDTAQRRFWATFDFSGKGIDGQSVNITKGVIDSLQWFRE